MTKGLGIRRIDNNDSHIPITHISSRTRNKIPWDIKNYGIIPYAEALEKQLELHQIAFQQNKQFLLLLQHTEVITLGRRTDPSHILLSEKELAERNIDLHKVDRGGSATYHGPGQLVGYVICKSSKYGGIHNFVSNILKLINRVLRSLGIESKIDFENPGIWTDTDPPRKLSAVGMSNKHGYTMHGFAINVDLPLTGFSAIVPCGLSLPVTTIAIETGKRYKVSEISNLIEVEFLNQFS